MHPARDGSSRRPTGEGSALGARSERTALSVIATGVLVLPAPTTLQVLWLVAVAGGASLAAVKGRRSPSAGSSPSDVR